MGEHERNAFIFFNLIQLTVDVNSKICKRISLRLDAISLGESMR